MALSSQCLSCHGCVLRHQVHHTDASLILDTLVSHTRSAASLVRAVLFRADEVSVPATGLQQPATEHRGHNLLLWWCDKACRKI
ncbi:hypothetical protein ABBQ32_000464 [Trebouxia sp. C0010 RCD-2024]